MMHEIITQGIGALAYLVIALSYFKKTKKSILTIQILAYILFTVHYSMLMARTGTMCNILGLISLILIYIFDYYIPKKKNLLVFIMLSYVTISFGQVSNFADIPKPLLENIGKLCEDTEGDKKIKQEKFNFEKYINDLVNKMQNNNNKDKPYMVTPCHHIFHARCLELWLEQKNECPYCRSKIPPLEI